MAIQCFPPRLGHYAPACAAAVSCLSITGPAMHQTKVDAVNAESQAVQTALGSERGWQQPAQPNTYLPVR